MGVFEGGCILILFTSSGFLCYFGISQSPKSSFQNDFLWASGFLNRPKAHFEMTFFGLRDFLIVQKLISK
jgi:hypothetical protein